MEPIDVDAIAEITFPDSSGGQGEAQSVEVVLKTELKRHSADRTCRMS